MNRFQSFWVFALCIYLGYATVYVEGKKQVLVSNLNTSRGLLGDNVIGEEIDARPGYSANRFEKKYVASRRTNGLDAEVGHVIDLGNGIVMGGIPGIDIDMEKLKELNVGFVINLMEEFSGRLDLLSTARIQQFHLPTKKNEYMPWKTILAAMNYLQLHLKHKSRHKRIYIHDSIDRERSRMIEKLIVIAMKPVAAPIHSRSWKEKESGDFNPDMKKMSSFEPKLTDTLLYYFCYMNPNVVPNLSYGVQKQVEQKQRIIGKQNNPPCFEYSPAAFADENFPKIQRTKCDDSWFDPKMMENYYPDEVHRDPLRDSFLVEILSRKFELKRAESADDEEEREPPRKQPIYTVRRPVEQRPRDDGIKDAWWEETRGRLYGNEQSLIADLDNIDQDIDVRKFTMTDRLGKKQQGLIM